MSGHDLLETFAARHPLKVRFDKDRTKIIPGKYGHIYDYGDGRLAVMIIPHPPRKNYWASVRARLLKADFVVLQNGDCEGSARFSPHDPEQGELALKVCRVKRKRKSSSQQRERQMEWLRASAGRAL